MSLKDNPCRKFQANIFNKSKCQNCFKPRESHILNDEDLSQAKPVYGGWLLLSPEGTNFDNPLHRSRKWQRRFFILYEHGLLRYALDEMPTTLPQGTINMNQCLDVIDGESRTGQKNSLCILTPEKEHFIRAECKEIINGWQEALMIYPRTNKQNQKKKRKVDPPTQQTLHDLASICDLCSSLPILPTQIPAQEPGPAKVTVTRSRGGSSPSLPSTIGSVERVPTSSATLWQEESRWSQTTIPCSRSASCLSQFSQSQPDSSVTTKDDFGAVSSGRKVRVESGYFSLEKTKSEPSPQLPQSPQSLPLSSSASSTFLGAASPRYNSESEPQMSPTQASDPLPSPSALSAGHSTISSSQNSLDSDPSGTSPSYEGCGGGENPGCVRGFVGRAGRSDRQYAVLSNVPLARRLTNSEAFRSEIKDQALRARPRSPGREEVARLFGEERRRPQAFGHFEDVPHVEGMDINTSNELTSSDNNIQRQGRSERRYLVNKHEISLDAAKDRDGSNSFSNLRRAKSLDRKSAETSLTPDLLNFKKGWMTKLYEDGVWKKHWFVLTDQSLRYYKDSIAEEASQVDGEIDLSTCYDVKEFPVQRNYGFQILCKDGACTLSAMTSGIRRNWIQAIMKNARPVIAPDVTRKNLSLKLSVLKPRSLPEEKINSPVLLEPCLTASPPLQSPKSGVQQQPVGNSVSAAHTEPRKSRALERRREGRSKTFDWTEFKIRDSEKCSKQRADTVDLSSSFSTTSSHCSPSSSSTSSLASSPASTCSLKAPVTCAAEKENERKGFHPTARGSPTHMPNTVTVTMTSTLNTTTPVQPSVAVCQEQGKMEIDHPTALHTGIGDNVNGTSGVRKEIEQRWHQVETTPLREEKQVPISTGTSANSDSRLPAHELAALLDKELGQKQKELDLLQKQNNILKEQLEDALGREQSAREGYVLQSTTSPPSSPSRAPWKHLHKLNQDLQGELEAQKHKQDRAHQQIRTLKRSYTEAQEAVERHETDIQALQAKLASAMAEILASEHAVARMRNELKMEQDRSKEQEEDSAKNEATLRAQLKDSEDRLREVEASLLERNQALRHLERQQALQRDHLKEVQRLQERLQEVTARLAASEESQSVREEYLRQEQHCIQESHEKERQSLCRKLAEAAAAQKEMEERLLETEKQVTLLLRGQQACGGKEYRDEMLKLQEEVDQQNCVVDSLRQSVQRLEQEKGHLTCRCQELLNQISEADREVNKLRNRLELEEVDYYTLEQSYERATQEFQKMSQFLREKEEEIRQTKEMYERLMERKEEDLKEALVKMTALGNSLEETEQKLLAKEDLLCQMSQSLSEKVASCNAEKDLQAKLIVAEDRIAELEQHLNALQLGYADLQSERQQILENSKKELIHTQEPFEHASGLENSSSNESKARRPRIRFSSIQCQKYNNLEDMEVFNISNVCVEKKVPETDELAKYDVSSPISQHTSDPEKFISIIHDLESKLLNTEEKLKKLTQTIEDQQSMQVLSSEELKRAENELLYKNSTSEATDNSNISYAKALICVEQSRERVRAILSSPQDTDSQLQCLSEIEIDLVNASLLIQQGQKNIKEFPAALETQAPVVETNAMHLFAKTLSFEAMVLNKMALLIQTSNSDLLQALVEIWEDMKTVKRDDKDCLAVVYAGVLTRKLMLESRFWNELDIIKQQCKQSDQSSTADDVDVDASVIFNNFIKAELAYSFQNLRISYDEKFRTIRKELAEAHYNLRQREMALKAIFDAPTGCDLKDVVKEVRNNCDFGADILSDIHPPELAPYMAQIETDEARNMAEEIVDKHIMQETCTVESIVSFQNAHNILAGELQRQAEILHTYAQELESSKSQPETTKMINALFSNQTSSNMTPTSLCLREALIQAQVAYVACRLRSKHEQDLKWCKDAGQKMDMLVQQHACSLIAIQEKYETSLQEQHRNFTQTVASLQNENQTLKDEISLHVNQLSQQQAQLSLLEEQFQREMEELKLRHNHEMSQAARHSSSAELMETTADGKQKFRDLLVSMDSMEEQHNNHVRKLEEQFEEKICDIHQTHKDEIEKLQADYLETIRLIKEHQLDQTKVKPCSHADDAATLMEEGQRKQGDANMSKDTSQEQDIPMDTMRDELENKDLGADMTSLGEKYQRDIESLKATYERGFVAMEETHQKFIEDLKRQHQREISKLLEERERLLAEETAATVAAIEAMKNAHKEELEKNQRSQISGLNSDIDELRLQYEEELQSIQRELEVLSEQYSQKCLENAHLAQALEAERQALRQCQRENQELNTHNQELNNRLTAEITRMRSCFSGDTAMLPPTQGKDVYELQVLLRIKESEVQCLKQEIHSLKDEIQSALRDKKYATDKYKDIYTELSIVKAKADCDISKLKEKLLIATEALGERTVDGTVTSGYDIMKSKSNPDFMKKEQTSTSRLSRGVRSKSVIEQVPWDS
ncbi:myosin phosphatase Rho-interacting protein isoform 2-T2 [Synchiropus picturatus]